VLVNLDRYLLAWFPLVVLALLIGLVRDRTYGRRLPEEKAKLVSVALAAVAFGLYVAALAVLVPFAEPRQALLVGGVWVAITLALDGLLRLLAPAPPPRRVEDDDLFVAPRSRSPVGALLLVWLGVAPWLFDYLIWRA
jgi:hypothetical protein